MTLDQRTIVAAIQKAADEAAAKGITVQVELVETGFFPSESTRLTVTATPPKKKE